MLKIGYSMPSYLQYSVYLPVNAIVHNISAVLTIALKILLVRFFHLHRFTQYLNPICQLLQFYEHKYSCVPKLVVILLFIDKNTILLYPFGMFKWSSWRWWWWRCWRWWWWMTMNTSHMILSESNEWMSILQNSAMWKCLGTLC